MKLKCDMPSPSGEGGPVSMSIEDILCSESGCHKRLEVFRGS